MLSTLALALGSCSRVPVIPGVTPYRMDIQQGNFVTQEAVSQLRKGMSRDQVRFLLGTPLVTDIFHANRWDYVFYREPAGGAREQRRLAVYFDTEGRLDRVDGDVMPSRAPDEAAPAAPAAASGARP